MHKGYKNIRETCMEQCSADGKEVMPGQCTGDCCSSCNCRCSVTSKEMCIKTIRLLLVAAMKMTYIYISMLRLEIQ